MHKRFQKVQSNKKYFCWKINYNVPLSWKDFKKYPRKKQPKPVKFSLKVTNEKENISKKVMTCIQNNLYVLFISIFLTVLKISRKCNFC